MSVQELKERLEQDKDLVILDTRGKQEWDEYHLEGAVHIPAPECRSRYKEVETKKLVAVLCNTAYRASLAPVYYSSTV